MTGRRLLANTKLKTCIELNKEYTVIQTLLIFELNKYNGEKQR
jgi:hypothetical protein